MCLSKLVSENYEISMVVTQPGDFHAREMINEAKLSSAETFSPSDPNSPEALHKLTLHKADLFILAGYGIILSQKCISIPKLFCINLHGGRLPQYRGSSPLNWSLINEEEFLGISIIKVDSGIDTGEVLEQAQKETSIDTTIKDAHDWANKEFPRMLISVLSKIEGGRLVPRKQKDEDASYYPRRFPDDGLILWDQLNAREIHARIRALSKPYPCARTFWASRELMLIKSEVPEIPFFGEPGRIYRKNRGRLLVCASDRAIWITSAEFIDNGSSLYDEVGLYDSLATVREASANYYRNFIKL